MDMIFKILLTIHVSFGCISLITFWIPIFTKKGGNLHIKVGKIYIFAMWIVVISAAILCMIRVSQGSYLSASFLGFLALLTSEPLWYAIVIIKHKKDIPDRVLGIRKVLTSAVCLSGATMVIWSLFLGLEGMSILLLIFGILGLTTAPVALRSYEKARIKSNWLADHLEGMIATGIAAYTAFLAFGGAMFLGDIFTGPLVAIPWVIPGIVGSISINILRRKMTKKESDNLVYSERYPSYISISFHFPFLKT